ncbi:hypothetical protein K490DRAFT_64092 [Saccharata proteae CBS 121410]|uniref:Uncharacterized protein n=1 Tax=Saccharata proteae CBS 121410 TaxID=1314787 RepID=A0A6A5YDG7_9PEZI|nr:hypothetical protein K490DRAFT_64092 [Saccharata proteae CBS 121410]
MYFDDSFASTPDSSSLASSPPSTMSSSPISIAGFSSPSSAPSSSSPRDISPSSRGSSCAYPSWPSGNSLGPYERTSASSYISDADLFPDELLDCAPLLERAPAPPREILMPAPAPQPLAPLYASSKPRKMRRSSSNKKSRPVKPMSLISESPKAPE